MKQKPRTELKIVGILLAFLAVVLAVSELVYIPVFFRLNGMSGKQMFRTEPGHHEIMMALGAWIFGLQLAMIYTCIYSAWIIFKHLDKVSDASHAA
jgi:hypothetical protein